MPRINDKIKLTQQFIQIDIDILEVQEASKFLLRCMKYIPKNENDIFTYQDLLLFMKNNYTRIFKEYTQFDAWYVLND